jgi:hypothetical protein
MYIFVPKSERNESDRIRIEFAHLYWLRGQRIGSEEREETLQIFRRMCTQHPMTKVNKTGRRIDQ